MNGRLAASSDVNKRAAIVKKMKIGNLANDPDVRGRIEDIDRLEKECALAKAEAESIASRARQQLDPAPSAVSRQAVAEANPQPSTPVTLWDGTHVGHRGGVFPLQHKREEGSRKTPKIPVPYAGIGREGTRAAC